MSEILLQAGGLCIDSPAGRPLFRDLNLTLGREQVAVVGRNGVGKSSLLEVLAGQEAPDRGAVRCGGRTRLVPQQLTTTEAEQRAGSPGERRMRALRLAWSAQPDLLLLDEPSQDLDADGADWLLDSLRTWAQGLIVVSHDRRVLRLFRNFFIAAESGCRYFAGSFDALLQDLDSESADAQKTYVRNLQRLLAKEKHDVTVARRRQRKKNLGRIHEVDRAHPRILLNTNRSYAQESQGKRAVLQKTRMRAAREWAKATRRALSVELPLEVLLPPMPEDSGVPVVQLEKLAAHVDGRVLFDGLDLRISSRDRIAITGPNGAGKTTLVEIIRREREPAHGRVQTQTARLGFVAQNASNWVSPDSLLYRLTVGSGAASQDDVAQLLNAHRFPFALAERSLASLSPGERVRAALICIFQRRPVVELLVLDEPTDHLDFVGIDALQTALRAWRGGLCVVSHDAEFLEAIGVERQIRLGSDDRPVSGAIADRLEKGVAGSSELS
jgi:ATPase subunit of ABC transporter with duplicated ATPase domains